MYYRKTIYPYFILFILVSGNVYSQNTVTGMVADSATMQPMADVNIKTKKESRMTVSDIRGYFSIQVTDDDTLIFSRVGYYSKKRGAKWMKEVGIVFITEEHKVLKPIVIEGDVLIPWLKKMPPQSPWRNPTNSKSFTETPGFQGVQTFGPGYVLSGPISRFSKYERERKKLKKIQAQNYRAHGYVDIVNDPEVKDKIIKDYGITEERYYELLAVFNEKNKDIIYELEANELISLLLMFYGENAKKR